MSKIFYLNRFFNCVFESFINSSECSMKFFYLFSYSILTLPKLIIFNTIFLDLKLLFKGIIFRKIIIFIDCLNNNKLLIIMY